MAGALPGQCGHCLAPQTKPAGRWEESSAGSLALGAQSSWAGHPPPPDLQDQSSAGQVMEGIRERKEPDRKHRQEGEAERKKQTERETKEVGRSVGEKGRKIKRY